MLIVSSIIAINGINNINNNNIDIDISANTTINTDKNDLININTASLKELSSLPSIGEGLAKNIIKYRAKHKFKNVSELLNVKDIGDDRYKAIKELVVVT